MIFLQEVRTLREEVAQEESRYHYLNCTKEVKTSSLKPQVTCIRLTLFLASPAQITESQIERAANQSEINQSMDLQVRRTALR